MTYRNLLLPILVFVTAMLAACDAEDQKTMIRNKGSDTLFNVAVAWADGYRSVDPSIEVLVSGGGSSTGIAALLNGTVEIANASRAIRPREQEMAEMNSLQPVQHIVAYDALAIFLHPNNPLEQISLGQLAEIFGEGGEIALWSDLGIEVPACQGQGITLISRQNNSGTYAYFRDTILGGGDFKLGTRDLRDSSDVELAVEQAPCAIGYGGLAYATKNVKLACVAADPDSRCVMPSVESAATRSYPISRPLFLYTNGVPQGHVAEYIQWIKGQQGQCIVLENGYAPVIDVSCI